MESQRKKKRDEGEKNEREKNMKWRKLCDDQEKKKKKLRGREAELR
jgi:hypothetical protein